ncbi:hypothetical protein MKW92_035268 [Papaver armeniacum]|nr:hypothetical protein MKW92_035268 [Papaver armeniacum]
MKFFNWMQNKIAGKQSASVLSSKKLIEVSTKNRWVSDWPNGLLAIGTFGYNSTDLTKVGQESRSSSSKRHGRSDCKDNQITEEQISPSLLSEVLGDKIWKILHRKKLKYTRCRTLSGRRGGVKLFNLPLDKFLNRPMSLEKIDCVIHLQLLRAIINENLYCPEISPATPTAKKFLKNGNCYLDKEDDGKGDDAEQQQNINDSCKWDKTDDDSCYHILELIHKN